MIYIYVYFGLEKIDISYILILEIFKVLKYVYLFANH